MDNFPQTVPRESDLFLYYDSLSARSNLIDQFRNLARFFLVSFKFLCLTQECGKQLAILLAYFACAILIYFSHARHST